MFQGTLGHTQIIRDNGNRVLFIRATLRMSGEDDCTMTHRHDIGDTVLVALISLVTQWLFVVITVVIFISRIKIVYTE